jgi:alkyldihydroxyacetonephosphate synthase
VERNGSDPIRREQKFWGWGEPGAGPGLPERAPALLREWLGVSGAVVSEPVALADVRLRPSAVSVELRSALERAVDAEHMRDDDATRVLRATGKSYLDLLALRAGECDAPDIVVAPGDHAQVQAVLYACAEGGAAVVPFGGGTSVVGGVSPERGRWDAAVSLDLGRLDAVLDVDERSRTARVQAGLRLPELDHALGAHGLRLGHVPQSYEWATVGGCAATRSAGQASTGFGRFDELVVGLRCATPAGELATLGAPASAAGPDLRELVLGSEGTLGAITELTLRVRPVPAEQRYEAWLFRSFAAGCEALRALVQAELAPDVARLSDEDETRTTLALAGEGGVLRRAGGAALRGLGYRPGALLIAGWEGEPDDIARRRRAAAKRLRSAAGDDGATPRRVSAGDDDRSGRARRRRLPGGVVPLGRGAGEAWRAARFAGPYLRDALLDRGVLVETLETATSWSALPELHRAVREAVAGALAATPPVVGCHVSHLYPDGASLYFTVLARQDPDDPAGQWRAAKRAAGDAIAAAGATITHHHAVGRDHVPWIAGEHGALGIELLRALKLRCDPAGIMNPGKLVP